MSNKRVSLTYTVDLEDLELEVSRLSVRASEALQNCATGATAVLTNTELLTFECATGIDETRRKLAKIDCMLADVGNIISHYLSYQASELTETPVSSSQSGTMTELSEKLNTFKELMAQNGLPTEEQDTSSPSDH